MASPSPMLIDHTLTPKSLLPGVDRLFRIAADKTRRLDRSWPVAQGTPVFTVNGRYTARGWTEWTQGFQYGSLILAGDALHDRKLLDLGRKRTVERMASHVTHIGVHDHGFNNLSTYGNLRRLLLEKRLSGGGGGGEWERAFYDMALKASGAVQAARWSGCPPLPPGAGRGAGRSKGDSRPAAATQSDDIFAPLAGSPLGYIYSFNGPHSLFVDTMRTTRILGVAWQLGHALMHENDKRADLLKRSVLHGITTARYILFHGHSGHSYDLPGRTSHEAIFNRNDGNFRCRSTQQGYSPFSTWTRGLAWALLGYAEELEFFATIADADFRASTGLEKKHVLALYEHCARLTADHYLREVTASDGVPYWDDGAPGLARMGDWRSAPADPYNDHEPVDSSAAAIAAQGLIRLAHYLEHGKRQASKPKPSPYLAAGLTVAATLLDESYVPADRGHFRGHQGLLLHSVYHRPNNWDYIPPGRSIPCGESSMWGDYHLLELALLLQRLAVPSAGPYPCFFDAAG